MWRRNLEGEGSHPFLSPHQLLPQPYIVPAYWEIIPIVHQELRCSKFQLRKLISKWLDRQIVMPRKQFMQG